MWIAFFVIYFQHSRMLTEQFMNFGQFPDVRFTDHGTHKEKANIIYKGYSSHKRSVYCLPK